MSHSCDISEKIISNGYSAGLDSIVNTALDLIKKHVFPGAKFVNLPQEITVTITKPTFGRYTLSTTELIFELDKVDLDKIIGDSTHTKGCYVINHGKIYLNKGLWCIETIIHETLHACSLTSAIPELMKYRALYEGLTEFYTGYIMYKEYRDAYENCWRTETGMKCQLTYEQQTKIWSAFCNFIPISYTTGIYFYSGSTKWQDEFNELVKKICNMGYKDFKNPFTAGGPATHLNLYKQCGKSFGSEFLKICASRNRFTDFANIKN